MTALECLRKLQATGWLLKDQGDHAPATVIPILEAFLEVNQSPCPKCSGQKSSSVADALAANMEADAREIAKLLTPPKRRGRPPKQK